MHCESIHDSGAVLDPPESTLRLVRFGNCDMYTELAAGGTASVCIGMHRGAEGFEKVVAIKRLLPAFSQDANFRAMLADEADISARTAHPYVRDVYDFGVGQDGAPYIVMEFLFGQPLAAVHRALAAAPDFARDGRHAAVVARLIAHLCEGLHDVHELSEYGEALDVVHRDVTPHNLFVLYDGSVRVTDFGIVRARVRRQTASGPVLKGKLPYMSPEYLGRRPYDRRSDVWSMGVVLWEMLTGLRLFRKESDALSVQAIATGHIPAPSSVSPDVDGALDAIVLRALSRNVEQRYRTARDLANDLEEWLARERRALYPSEIAAWLERLLPGARAELARIVSETREGLGRDPSPSLRPTSHPTSNSRPTTPALANPPSFPR